MRRRFNLIATFSKNQIIANRNRIPWPFIKEDINHFTKTTTQTLKKNKINSVIMGRKTWQNLPKELKPLPNRLNIILTKKYDFIKPLNVTVCTSIDEALDITAKDYRIESNFVIGGEQIYKSVIKDERCKKIYITEINKEYDGDRYFPKIPQWLKLEEEEDVYSKNINEIIIFKTYINNSDPSSQVHQYLDMLKYR